MCECVGSCGCGLVVVAVESTADDVMYDGMRKLGSTEWTEIFKHLMAS